MFNVTKEVREVGEVLVVYSEPGCGKTTLIAQAIKEAGDRGLFIPIVEDGLSPLQKPNARFDLSDVQNIGVTISNWHNVTDGEGNITKHGVVETLRWLCMPEQVDKFDVIALDSLNLISNSLEDYSYQTYFVNNPDNAGKDAKIVKALAYGFGKNGLIEHMADEWETVIKALRFLKDKGKKVFISCHRGVRKVKPVDEELEYDTYDIDLPFTKKVSLSNMLIAEADMVVYGKKNVTLAKGKTKTRAIGDDSRILVTQGTPTVAAKFRGNAPEEIAMNWEELKQYL